MSEKKEEYVAPLFEAVEMEVEDVICNSAKSLNENNQYENLFN